MWTECKGGDCKYCKKGEAKISSSLVMPNTNNNGIYVHNTLASKVSSYTILK